MAEGRKEVPEMSRHALGCEASHSVIVKHGIKIEGEKRENSEVKAISDVGGGYEGYD